MKSPLEKYFTSLQGKRIIVLGLGVSNRPLVRLLLEFGCDVVGCDRTPREKLDAEVLELEAMGCRLSVGDGYLDGMEADLLFRTPGMHPGNPAIRALADKGAQVTSDISNYIHKRSACRQKPNTELTHDTPKGGRLSIAQICIIIVYMLSLNDN